MPLTAEKKALYAYNKRMKRYAQNGETNIIYKRGPYQKGLSPIERQKLRRLRDKLRKRKIRATLSSQPAVDPLLKSFPTSSQPQIVIQQELKKPILSSSSPHRVSNHQDQLQMARKPDAQVSSEILCDNLIGVDYNTSSPANVQDILSKEYTKIAYSPYTCLICDKDFEDYDLCITHISLEHFFNKPVENWHYQRCNNNSSKKISPPPHTTIPSSCPPVLHLSKAKKKNQYLSIDAKSTARYLANETNVGYDIWLKANKVLTRCEPKDHINPMKKPFLNCKRCEFLQKKIDIVTKTWTRHKKLSLTRYAQSLLKEDAEKKFN